jgi:hypothetical protein
MDLAAGALAISVDFGAAAAAAAGASDFLFALEQPMPIKATDKTKKVKNRISFLLGENQTCGFKSIDST